MLAQRDLDPIPAAWQSEVQHAVEAGAAPLLPLGNSDDVLTALVALEALRALMERRNDMTQPIATAGGGSGAWLAALALPQSGEPARSPAAMTLFSGADLPTHIASAATQPRRPGRLQAPGGRFLPAGYADMVAPEQHPAAPFTWEALPFRTLTAMGAPFGVQSLGSWAGWLGITLALLLVAGALLR